MSRSTQAIPACPSCQPNIYLGTTSPGSGDMFFHIETSVVPDRNSLQLSLLITPQVLVSALWPLEDLL